MANKRFILVSSNKHRGGYSVSVNNGDLEAFKKNPSMLWMHQRSSKYTEQQILPIGRWQNILVENGMITAEADINMKQEFSAQIGQMVEDGYLNAASAGIRVLEVAYVKNAQGEEELSVTKWEMLEASIVDIPLDGDCTAQFYIENDKKELQNINSLDELKQAFPACLKTEPAIITHNHTEMTDEQTTSLLQSVAYIKEAVDKNTKEIEVLKQQMTPQPPVAVPATPAPQPPVISLKEQLQQANPITKDEVKKDFDWYSRNDVQALDDIRKSNFPEYARLCHAAGVMLQQAI